MCFLLCVFLLRWRHVIFERLSRDIWLIDMASDKNVCYQEEAAIIDNDFACVMGLNLAKTTASEVATPPLLLFCNYVSCYAHCTVVCHTKVLLPQQLNDFCFKSW
jgi:hypothetical protein